MSTTSPPPTPNVRPTVAIVGRPNVGKSTLFNRLTGTRDALVSDLPGLTRDRRGGNAIMGGHSIIVVDTAGLEESTKGSIAARMRAKSEEALKAADAILFVIDARDGITPADKEFARIARNSSRPIILVANKAEGRAGEGGVIEAFSLGLGDPVAISAEHGEGLTDLQSDILAILGLTPIASKKKTRRGSDREAPGTDTFGFEHIDADNDDDAPRRPLRVCIIGRPNAGKSTLVNALLGEERMITGPEAGLTRDAVWTDTIWNDRPIRLWDTAGLRRKARIEEKAEKLSVSDAIRAINFAEVCVLLIDAERPFEQQDLIIADRVISEGRALVIAVNKWDVIADKNKMLKDLRETVTESLAMVPGVAMVTLSARSGRGVDTLRKSIIDAYEIWNRRVPTNPLNRWLDTALTRHSPPAVSGRRIKIRYITQASSRPPTFVAFCSQAGRLPDSYVKYLVNSLRDAFDLPGTPIRFNLRKPDNPFAED
ncbi:MAG: ribosome biogenesis GTPase Der [Hyphomicrobiaceae bacterium]